MESIISKVTAYIVRKIDGTHQLLVFKEQGFEHLGFQVPGGTVEKGEDLETALFREVKEEAGIKPFNIQYLGEYSYFSDVNKQPTVRHYYQMEAACPDEFIHTVISNDKDNGWIYKYSWINIKEISELYGYLGKQLNKIRL